MNGHSTDSDKKVSPSLHLPLLRSLLYRKLLRKGLELIKIHHRRNWLAGWKAANNKRALKLPYFEIIKVATRILILPRLQLIMKLCSFIKLLNSTILQPSHQPSMLQT